MLTVLSYNALGDALSDTLDPRHAGSIGRLRGVNRRGDDDETSLRCCGGRGWSSRRCREAPDGQGGPPGVLQVAVLSDVTLNPFTLPQQLPTLLVSKVLFGTLTRYQPGDGRPVGDLAASWKTTLRWAGVGVQAAARASSGTTASPSPRPT